MSEAATSAIPLDIIPSVSLEGLLGKRDAAMACLQRIRDAADEYQQIAESVGLGAGYDNPTAQHLWSEPLRPREWRRDLDSAEWMPLAGKVVDAALWEHLLAMSGMRTFLDKEAREEWDKAIRDRSTPELTIANVRATFQAIDSKRPEFFRRGVLKLFRSLSWDYKTNRPQMFGRKAIIRHVVDGCGFACQTTCSSLDDLMRAFCLLDGQPEPDHRQGAFRSLSKGMSREPRSWETPYFSVRTFKNGNGHLVFSRPDLVEKLNKVLHEAQPDALPMECR